MIYEMRVYQLVPGGVSEFNALVEEYLPIIERHLDIVGFWSTEIGALNEITYICAFEDFEDRERRRKSKHGDDELAQVGAKLVSLCVSQYNKILIPTSFSTLK